MPIGTVYLIVGSTREAIGSQRTSRVGVKPRPRQQVMTSCCRLGISAAASGVSVS